MSSNSYGSFSVRDMNDGIGERLVLIIPRWESQWLTTTWQTSLKLFLAAAVKLRTAAGVLQESTWSNLITHSSFSQKHASAVAWKTLSKVCGSSPSPMLWKDVTVAGAGEEPAQATLCNTFVWCPDWSPQLFQSTVMHRCLLSMHRHHCSPADELQTTPQHNV